MVVRGLGIVLVWALLSGFTLPVVQLTSRSGAGAVEAFATIGVRLEERKGFATVPPEWVHHALRHHRYPYDLEAMFGPDLPIYLSDMQIVSRGADAVAITVNGSLVLFSGTDQPDRTLVEETLLHELAHVLASRVMKEAQWAEYRKLRDLGPEYRESSLWHRRPGEIFAEDFAHLFGTVHARKAPWPFPELPEPENVPGLEEFLLKLPGPDAPRRITVYASLSEWASELAKVPGYPALPESLPWQGDGTLTRAQAAFLLSQAIPPVKGGHGLGTADRDAWPAWAVTAIEKVQEHAVLPALPDGRFAPDRFLTEQEAALAIQQLRLMLPARLSPVRGAGKIMRV